MTLPSPAPPRAPCPSAVRPVVGLTPSQEAALARLRYALEAPGLVLLVGAAGVGKSLVLGQLAAELAAAAPPPGAARPATDAPRLIDDAHALPGAALGTFAEIDGPVVLAGRGRLLSLVAREARLSARLRLRAVVPPFTLDDTRALVVARLAAVGGPAPDDGAVRVLHELAAGIPAALARMVDLSALFVAEGRRLSAADVEAIHRRLDPVAR